MKKTKQTIKTIVAVTIAVALFGCSGKKDRHIGEWKGRDDDVAVTLILDKTNHAVFIIGDEVFGGQEYENNGEKLESKYEIDYSKKPVWLDIVIYGKDPVEEKNRLLGIVEFITDKKIKYRMRSDGERYKDFGPEDEETTLVLEKTADQSGADRHR